ncbi:MAG TPA: carotenoid oxygenase family protein [Bryobacteraceae bacterium]|nr:carotenoid oxygenase family protein [Bryobacteraceae bacterium]
MQNPEGIAAPDNAPLLERCFLFDEVEDSYDVSGITGCVPEWLRGSYYVNGPARFQRAGQRYKHWLDGDGMVCALRFTDDGVGFTNRFIGTSKLHDEDSAGKFLYREFGTAFPGDLLRRKVMLEPPVNVSIYSYNGKLLAFGEQSVPVELDPVTLETRGEYDFNGSLNEVSPFSAHAKTDPANGHLINFGISFSVTEPMLNIYEFDAVGGFIRRRRHRLQYQHSVHDFGFTPNHVVFYLSPLLMDFQRFWSEDISVMESLKWDPEKGTRLFIAPRSSKNETAFSLDIEPRYCLHMVNCHEAGTRLIVDVLEIDREIYREYQPIPDLFQTVPPCRPARYIVDLESRTLLDRVTMSYNCAPDFPAVDAHRLGLDYNDFWALGIGASGKPGRKFFDQLIRGSWKDGDVCDMYQTPRGEYLGGEPVSIVNPKDPDEAVVVVQHLLPAENRVDYVLLDAFALKSGPIARLPLRHPIHPGFHTSFHPA